MHIGKEHDRALPDIAVKTSLGKLLASDGVGLAKQIQTLLGDLADDADAEARARERLTPDDFVRQAKFGTDGTPSPPPDSTTSG